MRFINKCLVLLSCILYLKLMELFLQSDKNLSNILVFSVCSVAEVIALKKCCIDLK